MIGNRDSHLIEQVIKPTFSEKQAHVGMPPLVRRARAFLFFEFWPAFIVYLPVVGLWLFQAIRYRGLTVPLCANPGFYLGGLVGESKADNFLQAGEHAKTFIAPWCRLTNNCADITGLMEEALQKMAASGLVFPLIAKPDMGSGSAGVRIVRSQEQLEEYFHIFPDRAAIILQELIPWDPEAGIFYIRKPGESRGEIFSLTLKYQPYVYGNGVDTLRALIEGYSRSRKLGHLYGQDHENRLDDILEAGQPFRLSFAGSRSRGAVFRDGRHLITDELLRSFDELSKDINGFYFGRFDVRFEHERSLRNGQEFKIVEVNGISSEAGHIWDAQSSLLDVYRTLFQQYNTLFKIGAINRARGHRSGSLIQVIKGLLKEIWLGRQYPDTE